MKLEIDTDSLEWWAKPLLVGILLYDQNAPKNLEKLKRYADLAEIDKLQELEDKKPLG